MSDRRAELNRLMNEHGLTARQVGAMVRREPHTVRSWRCKGGREIPEGTLELLKLKLAAAPGAA